MRQLTENCLRAASVLALAALLSACCAYQRRAPRPAPAPETVEEAGAMEPSAPAMVEKIDQGRIQHWNGSNHWARHPYR